MSEEKYEDIYKKLESLIGEENTIKFFEEFGGKEISFPEQLYADDYIKENNDGADK